MKKFLCILLAALLCLPLLVACGKKDETPAANNGAEAENNEAAERAAAEKAAAQQADKQAIAEAFNASMKLPDLSTLISKGEGEGTEQGTEPGSSQGAEQGEEPALMSPRAMAEMLIKSVEALSKSGDAETKFDTSFVYPISVLLSLHAGVLYANIMGEPTWITLNDGIATTTEGLPLATEREDLIDLLTEALMDTGLDISEDMLEDVADTEVDPEMINEIVAALPKLTANDLVAADNGLYVLTGDYIARFCIAVMNVTNAMSASADEEASAADASAAAAAAAQQAEGEAQMKAMIVGLVDALGLKIGFKLTGNVITRYSIDYDVDEEAAAAVNAMIAGFSGGAKNKYDAGEAQTSEPRPTGVDDDEEEAADESEGGLKVGTAMHLALTLDTEGLPTALEANVTIPGEIGLTLNMTAAYLNKAVTGFTCTADVTLYQDLVSENYVAVPKAREDWMDPEEEYYDYVDAELYADMNVHAALTFTPALFAAQATGKPVDVTVAVTYDANSITRYLDYKPVATFEGLKFEEDDNDMSDPQNMAFTLTATNNGRGLIRFVAASVAGEQSVQIGALDVTVGSAPNFVAQTDSPFVELSDVVTRLLAKKDLKRGVYAYVIGENTYYFAVDGTTNFQQDPETGAYVEVVTHAEAHFECCVAANAESPYTSYILITVDAGGELELTPVGNSGTPSVVPEP